MGKYGIDFGSEQLHRWAREQAGEIMPGADVFRAFRAWMQPHGMPVLAQAGNPRRRRPGPRPPRRLPITLSLSKGYYLSDEQGIPKTVNLATEGYDERGRPRPTRYEQH